MTVDFKIVLVRVFASAVTVIADEPLKSTPLIALAVANVSAVVAVPEVQTVLSPVFAPETEEAPAPKVRTEVLATLPVNPTVPVSTVKAVVNVAFVTVPAFPETVVWSPVLVPETLPSKATVSVFGVVPAVIVKPTVSVDTGLVTFNSGVQSV